MSNRETSSALLCPECKEPSLSVIDSRVTSSPMNENETIRRRRVCNKCQHRYTTYEIELEPIVEASALLIKLVEILKSLVKVDLSELASVLAPGGDPGPDPVRDADELERLAARARETGDRVDLLQYLKARRNNA